MRAPEAEDSMTNYQSSAVIWAGQEPGTSGTSHINNAAGKGKRAKTAAKGSAMPQPLMGPVHPPSGFEEVNNLVAGIQSGDSVALTALTVYGSSAVSRAVATGRLAQQRRR